MRRFWPVALGLLTHACSGNPRPPAVKPAARAVPAQAPHQLDYVIVVPSAMKAATARLAAHRGKSHKVAILTVEEAYAKSPGKEHAQALRDELARLAETGPLRFVLLAGATD